MNTSLAPGKLLYEHPLAAKSLLIDTLTTVSIQREWTLNLGQRSAFERLAHLFCEIFWRLRALGMTNRLTCELPVTQADLADALGLSSVHVNRTLQELRAARLVAFRGKVLTIENLAALERAALFNPDYLHLDQARNGG